MQSIWWYCALAVVGLAIAIIVLCKKKNYAQNILFFLFAMMLAFLCEMFVLLLILIFPQIALWLPSLIR